MKKVMYPIVLVLFSCYCYGQTEFSLKGSSNYWGNQRVGKFVDIDRDGDQDIVCAYGSSVIAWFENTDGTGNFGDANLIFGSPPNNPDSTAIRSMCIADIDNDGYEDVISTFLDELFWFNNQGNGTFGNKRTVSKDYGGTTTYTGDFDNDGDIDIISTKTGGVLAWFENLDGLGDFEERYVLTDSIHGIKSPITADINGDGILDILTIAGGGGSKLAWYESINEFGNFSVERIISTNVKGAVGVVAADFDNDGDIDIVSSSSIGNGSIALYDIKVALYRNLDGDGNFGSQEILRDDLTDITYLGVGDVDNDGDMDLLHTNGFYVLSNTDRFGWFENINGLADFEFRELPNPFRYFGTSMDIGDMDGDGDNDILVTFLLNIAWYENLGDGGITDLKELNKLEFSIYPVPASSILKIQSKLNLQRVIIYDQLGKEVLNAKFKSEVDISSLPKGIYMCKVESVSGKIGLMEFVK